MEHEAPLLTRRNSLRLAGATAVAALVGVPASRAVVPASRKRSMRIAQISDIHVQPELAAGEGFTGCLRHLHAQADRPEWILNTGDSVMDVMRQGLDRSQLQWDLWKKILKQECSIPMSSILGNHDIFGWHPKSQTTGNESGWGKGMALQALGMSNPYWSVDRNGWHIIGLDSVQWYSSTSFIARLDDEQILWLENDLAANRDKPTLVLSHMPIFSLVNAFNYTRDPGIVTTPWFVGKGDTHTDYRQIKDIFKKNPQVKCCLSGHVHLQDRVEYLGVTYLCGGAVSGNWWSGSRFDECEPGYSLIDLYDDGTVERQYVTYGWNAQVPKKADDHADNVIATRPASTQPGR